MPRVITEDEYRAMKFKLRLFSPLTVARHYDRHLATVTKIAASRDFDHYRMIIRAEHPPVKHSLADRIDDLDGRVSVLEQRDV